VDRLRALGELAAGMAHEVRNPLTSISGSVQVLKKSLMLDGESQHLMDTVIREAGRLNALITDFLLFAKPATKMTKIDLRDIINETVNIFKNSPESGNIDIQLKIEDGLIVEGDSRQLKQVFWNLFINAGNAMPDNNRDKGQGARGKIIVEATIREEDVEVTISDTGMGIPPENIERIFDPFFTTTDSGTGLGLAVVHRIIENHNGKIAVKSKKSEGTSFKITLPVAKESELEN
jgi:two-component system sensor histidine kinase PilS (NtrC family)